MSTTQRRYSILSDFTRVYDFLEKTYDFETLNSYLLSNYFEYAQHHNQFNYMCAHRIGLWENKGEIAGISAYEMKMGMAQLHTKPEYKKLLHEMLIWAENEISIEKDGKRELDVYITNKEDDKKKLLVDNGYHFTKNFPIKIFRYDRPFVERELPEGFSLIDGNRIDYLKLKICYYRGFNHGDMPPSLDIDNELKRYTSPHTNALLTTVVVAPDGEYACALGMWMDYRNKYAYLEPLATIPKYRRMGLATIALTEAMKKTKTLGAEYCFGGGNEFYTAIGFEALWQWEAWKKVW